MKVFVIPDLHFPYTNKKVLKKVINLIKQEKPTHVIQLGDILDQYSFSKFSRSLNLTTPKKEIKRGLGMARQFWKDIQKAAPKAKYLQLLGNHDIRIQKRIAERLPELESLFDLQNLYDFKGVKVSKSDRDHLMIDGVIYTHGHYSKSIDHAKYYLKPTVHGHLHRAGLSTFGDLWSMDVGHLADEKSLPLSYTASKTSRWHMAVAVVENSNPRLILIK